MSAEVHCQKPGCGKAWPRDPVLEVACPSCSAPVGARCKRPSGHGVWGPHGRFCEARDLAADREGAYGPCPLDCCGLAHKDPAAADRQRLELELRAKSPLRAPIRGGGRFPRRPVDQHDVDGLALFDVVRSPTLF